MTEKIKYIRVLFALILIAITSYYAIQGTHSSNIVQQTNIIETQFSVEKAFAHIKEITKKPHFYGSKEHKRVADYLQTQLRDLGFETRVQEQLLLSRRANGLIKPKNIIGRIKGTKQGPSLLLMSHYDSVNGDSHGAGDAASGVATVLEGVRAYLAKGKKPVNDIIVLFTDAEELGLEGAHLFVTKHPWANKVGLALNFEARGTGGPSNMIVETNGGNSNLIEAFSRAGIENPYANSLMYSVYKVLPNDTDSTVFRELKNIDGFFFAFIDEPYNYHTAGDNIESLDSRSVLHQGEYLLPLLNYFSGADLTKLKSASDSIYFNSPIVGMVQYSFAWRVPMLVVAILGYIALLIYGFKKKKLRVRVIVKGGILFLSGAIIAGTISYYGWQLLLKVYPQYKLISIGFFYNGHSYIGLFTSLSLGIGLLLYKRFANKNESANLLIAPLGVWLILNIVISIYLPGASYLIIPVYLSLASFWLILKNNQSNLWLLLLIALPTIFLLAPLIYSVPVLLGSSLVFVSSVLSILCLGLLLPVVAQDRFKQTSIIILLIAPLYFLMNAHIKSDFNEQQKEPTSLTYYKDLDKNKNFWLTSDKELNQWNESYFKNKIANIKTAVKNPFGEQYNSGYSFAAEAEDKAVLSVNISKSFSVEGNGNKKNKINIKPQRKINKIRVFTNRDIEFKKIWINGIEVEKNTQGNKFYQRRSKLFLEYFMSDDTPLTIDYISSEKEPIEFTVFDYSYDLMNNQLFKLEARPNFMMAKPYSNTDRIITKQSVIVDSQLN